MPNWKLFKNLKIQEILAGAISPARNLLYWHRAGGRTRIAKLELSTGTFQATVLTRREGMKRQFVLKLMAPRYNSVNFQV